MNWLNAAKYVWASPCTLIGLLLASPLLLFGGTARWHKGALEVCHRQRKDDCGAGARALRFHGIVFGHVILAVTAEELEKIGPHERVHVEQYEHWGPLFLPAYALSSLWQVLRGRRAYYDNHFEAQARMRSAEARKQ